MQNNWLRKKVAFHKTLEWQSFDMAIKGYHGVITVKLSFNQEKITPNLCGSRAVHLETSHHGIPSDRPCQNIAFSTRNLTRRKSVVLLLGL